MEEGDQPVEAPNNDNINQNEEDQSDREGDDYQEESEEQSEEGEGQDEVLSREISEPQRQVNSVPMSSTNMPVEESPYGPESSGNLGQLEMVQNPDHQEISPPDFSSPRIDGTKARELQGAQEHDDYSKIRDQHVEKLQQINIKLRNRIKDLNQLVEKALERQQTKINKKGGFNSALG